MFEGKYWAYKLVDKVPVKCTLEEISNIDRRIQRDEYNGVIVSTVFLPFDHSFNEEGPILFETLVFGGKNDGLMRRYKTYDEAVDGHNEICYFINKESIDRDNKLKDLGI